MGQKTKEIRNLWFLIPVVYAIVCNGLGETRTPDLVVRSHTL